jgi:prepilin-type N-terminal cleavage/methylation domain-containing protein
VRGIKFLHPKFYSQIPRSGFTLIEILVVVAVTLIISTVVIVYGGRSRGLSSLSIEASKIAQVVLRAKALAISTYNIPPIPCGYGLKVDYSTREYSLVVYDYAPTDPECADIADGLVQEQTRIVPLGTGTVPQTYALSEGVKFPQPPSGLVEYVLFVPPDPKTYIFLRPGGGGGPPAPALTSGSGEIKIETEDGSGDISIFVTPFGQLSFQ